MLDRIPSCLLLQLPVRLLEIPRARFPTTTTDWPRLSPRCLRRLSGLALCFLVVAFLSVRGHPELGKQDTGLVFASRANCQNLALPSLSHWQTNTTWCCGQKVSPALSFVTRQRTTGTWSRISRRARSPTVSLRSVKRGLTQRRLDTHYLLSRIDGVPALDVSRRRLSGALRVSVAFECGRCNSSVLCFDEETGRPSACFANRFPCPRCFASGSGRCNVTPGTFYHLDSSCGSGVRWRRRNSCRFRYGCFGHRCAVRCTAFSHFAQSECSSRSTAIFRGRCGLSRGARDFEACKGVGGFAWRRDPKLLLCGRRRNPKDTCSYESYSKETTGGEGQAAYRSSASGRAHKVFGRACPQHRHPVVCHSGGAGQDEVGDGDEGKQSSFEAKSVAGLNGHAEPGEGVRSSSSHQANDALSASPQADGGDSTHGRLDCFSGGGGGGSRSGGSGRRNFSNGRFGAEPSPDISGQSVAIGRPSPGLSSKQLFNIFKGGPGQGKIADRAWRKIRQFHALDDAACNEEDEASYSYPNLTCPDCGVGFLNGELLGKIRWFRKSKRARNHSLCPLLCGGCSSQGGHARGSGALSTPICGHRAGKLGSGSMGSSIPASPIGRSPFSAVDLQQSREPNVDGQISGLCPSLPTEMGHHLIGLSQGVGLHSQQEDRDWEEGTASSSRRSTCTKCSFSQEKAEVPKGKGRRRRRPARCRSFKQPVIEETFGHSDSELVVHGPMTEEDGVSLLEPLSRSGNGSERGSCGFGHSLHDYEAWLAKEKESKEELEERIEVKPSSLFAWSRKLLKHVLAARTSFSYFVLQCLSHRDRRSCPVATALFPIPLPEMDVWDGPCRLGVSRRKRAAFQRVLQLVILATNFVHARDPWRSLSLMRRRPSRVHRDVFARLMALTKAGGPVEDYSVVGSGRKSAQLDARHNEVLEILQSLGLSEASKYHSGSAGRHVPLVNDRDELVPYRPLNAERIKLTGSANWDCSPYLSDLLYLPFVEPRISMFDILPPAGSYPDVRGSDGSQEHALCLVWDARNLLYLVPEQLGPKHISSFTRVFGNYKNQTTDRQIGDRRGQNFKEGRISGPSRTLPVMTTLLQLCPKIYEEVMVGSVTDRKDFLSSVPDLTRTSVAQCYLPSLCPFWLPWDFCLW